MSISKLGHDHLLGDMAVSLEIGHTDLFGIPKDLLTRMDLKSIPSHGNSIPLPTPFAESRGWKFPSSLGLGE